jgi:hypothetical protein
LHSPVVPQLAAPWSVHWPVGSLAPAGTGEQVPALPTSAQDMHLPAQAVAQQTPCAQVALWQSPGLEQAAPLGLRPHDPPLQVDGGAQSASLAQLDLQALTPQVNGAHEVAVGVAQVPAPSQVAAGVNVIPGIGQVAPAQAVPCGYFWHVPAWHLPLVPHDDAPWSAHRLAGSGRPVATAVQSPIVPVIAQETHDPPQAVAQQTPCAHWPDWHSVAFEQNAPFGLSPHEPCVQTTPPAQFASLPHET